VQKAGCPVLEITTDLIATRNLETFFRFRRADTRVCSNCHVDGPGSFRDRPNYDNINVSKALGMQDTRMTWDFIKKIRDITQMKIVLKGILTEQDARLCLKYGVDGIHVSNHGGRAEDNMRGSLECLPDIVKVAKGKVPILFDSGVRRGTDVFKAIALGADGVCIGRPYLWGLGAFGQPGVEKVMDIIRHELFSIMQQMGTTSLKEINMQYLVKTTGAQAGVKEL
jgi:isopentenyl diphosphate isomerase/L-lactate dehydrogenase-like FMN-dependent dehydrogenase